MGDIDVRSIEVDKYTTPIDYGIQMPRFRENQLESIVAIGTSNKEFVVVDAPTGSGKCLEKNSLVFSGNGLQKVGFLVLGDSVFSVHDSMKTAPDSVSYVFPEEKKECIEIETRYGYSIECTPEHKIATFLNGDIVWKNAGNINDDDFLCIVKNAGFPEKNPSLPKFNFIPKPGTCYIQWPLIPEEFDLNLAYMFGVITGDGGMTSKHAIRVTTMDTDIILFLLKEYKKFGVTYSLKINKKSKADDVVVNSCVLKSWFNTLGLTNALSIHKEVPWIVMQGTKEIVREFLSGLFDTDGSVWERGIEYGTSSPVLAKQVHLLLLKFGIVSNLQYREKTNSFRVIISGLSARTFRDSIGFKLEKHSVKLDTLCEKECNPNFETIPNVYGLVRERWQVVKKWCNENGVNFDKFSRKNRFFWDAYSKGDKNPSLSTFLKLSSVLEAEVGRDARFDRIIYSDLSFDKVTSIKNTGLQDVVDISVLVNNNFVAGGILVHNSAVGIALSRELDLPIRVMTKTRSLQDQYAEKRYDGRTLYGLAAYECQLIPGLRASECVYPHNMPDCPRQGSCAYLRAKQAMLAHDRQVISYAYWFVADYLTKKEDYAANLYFDEAHDLPTTTMQFLEKLFDRKWEQETKHRVKTFPTTTQPLLKKLVASWLQGVFNGLKEESIYLEEQAKSDSKAMSRYVVISREATQIESIIYQLSTYPDEMIIIVNEDRSLLVAPLSARMFKGFLANHIFEKAIFTSATIGNVATLMGGLGFKRELFDFIEVPSRFPASSMPVYVPPDAPKISFNSGESDYQQQAKIIHDTISSAPPEWSGFIHTASTAHAYALANRLAKLGLGDRIWVTPRGSSSHKIQAWTMQKSIRPNTIVLSWDMWTGVDGFDEEINIIAKVPFPSLDQLGKARMERDKTFYTWQTASRLEQAWGRNRRGDPAHYEKEGEPTRRICLVVDNNIGRVYNQLSSLAKARIVKENINL